MASIPIVVVSDTTRRMAPELRRREDPAPHYQFWVSPTIPVEAIASAWLDLLVQDGASHGSNQGPFDWFPGILDITADKLSEKGRSAPTGLPAAAEPETRVPLLDWSGSCGMRRRLAVTKQ